MSYSPQELAAALKKAHEAGDTAAAESLARALQQQQISSDRGLQMPPTAAQQVAAPSTVPDTGSIADAAGQGLSFGFADEIAGGVGASVNSVANLLGKGTGDSFGEAYRGIRDAARGNYESYAHHNPKTALAAEIGGGLLTGGAGAARAGALKGAQSLGRLGAIGAAQGGVYGVGASDADTVGGLLTDAAKGATIGGAGGVVLPAAGRAVANRLRGAAGRVDDALGPGIQKQKVELNIVPEAAKPAVKQSVDEVADATANTARRYADDVNLLRDKGVKLTTGQRTGSDTVKAYETTLRGTTGGGSLNTVLGKQREQFQTELLRMAGAPSAVAQTGHVTEDAIEATGKALSDKYAHALRGKTVRLGDEFLDDLGKVEAKHSDLLTSQQRNEIRTLVDDFLNRAAGGRLTAKKYQALRSVMAQRAKDNAGRPWLGNLFSDLKNSLDDAFAKSAGISNKNLNNQYAHFKQLETLWRRGGGTKVAQGELPLASLNSLAKRSPGSKEWKRFVNAASAVLGDAIPNSGTATRQSLLRTLSNVGSAGSLPLAALGLRLTASQALSQGAGAGVPGLLSGGLRSAAGRAQNAANRAGASSGGLAVASLPGLLSNPDLPR